MRWCDIPDPMMAFLRTRFRATNWRCIFFAEGEEPSGAGARGRYHSKATSIPRRAHLPPPEVEEQEQVTAGGARAPQDDDPYFNVDEDSFCHYIVAYHYGDIVTPQFAIRMKSKNASPRWRKVCVDCVHRVDADSLVDRIIELRGQHVSRRAPRSTGTF